MKRNKAISASMALAALASAWFGKLGSGALRKRKKSMSAPSISTDGRIRVLEVYPRYCWSFDAANEEALEALRLAVTSAEAAGTIASVHETSEGRAFKIFGSPLTVDLADKFFDRVIVRFEPTAVEQALLNQKKPRWLKAEDRFSINTLPARHRALQRSPGFGGFSRSLRPSSV